MGKSNGAAGHVAGLDVSSTPTSTANGGAGFRFNDGAALHDTPLQEAGFHIVVWQVDDSQAYADATMYVDGTLPPNTFAGGGGSTTSTTTFSGNDLELLLGTGRGANGALLPGDNFSGQLAEFLVFNDQLTKGQINLVANYLSTEYNLPFAYDTTLNLFAVEGLSWNGGAANFDAAWNPGDGAGGPAGSNVNPFIDDTQALYLGNNGTATFDNATNTAAGSNVNALNVGTASAGLIIAGTEGNGTLTVSGSKSLTIGNGVAPTGSSETGDMVVGENGFTGVMNWRSTGTLTVDGRLRIGQGGTGVFNQNAGVVDAGDVGGALKFLAVGNGAGSEGTYNLNNGRLLPGGGLSGTELRQLRIGYDGAEGLLKFGDGVGAAGTARIESRDDIYVGQEGGNGTLVIESDGVIQLQGSSAEFHVANGGGATGVVIQNGGSVTTPAPLAIGVGAGSTGEYRLNAGTVTASSVTRVGSNSGQGAFRISGSASFVSSGSVFVGQGDLAGSEGLLELTGSASSHGVGSSPIESTSTSTCRDTN